MKNVDIGEISSEPYNLFDEALEIGSIREDNGQNNDNITGVSRSKNYIKVVPGYSYTLEYPTTANLIIYEYDENNGYIESYSTSSTTSVSITLTNITRYVRFAIGNNDLTAKVCFHIAGTRTGYSPHTQSYTLPFKYQGSGVGTAHDTLEITDTEYVFTKNITEDNLSNYAFYYADSTKFLYTTRELNGCRTDSIWSPNALTNISGYKLVDSNKLSDNDVACTIYTGKFYIRNDALTEQQLKDVIANKTIKYQLATPQVVRIPKKHLAAVDLGTLNWVYNSGLFYVALKGIKKALSYDAIPNLCCSKYLTASKRQIDNGSPDKIIGTSDNIEYIYIIDSDYTDATTFKQAMSGVYLFYETEAEVEDIDFEIGVEAGGTLTSNLFSWVENQQTDFTVDFVTKSVNGITIETDLTKKTIRYYGTASANATCGFISSSNDKNNLTVGHKYLLKLNKIGNSGNSKCSVVGLNSSWLDIQDNIYTGIAASQYGQVIIYSGEQVDFTIQYQIIDLTHGFGAGNEPTSINDPRIQYIIKQGYIQTNTTGTNKSVASEVLPNIGFKIKCR